jgi:hypothetical protein
MDACHNGCAVTSVKPGERSKTGHLLITLIMRSKLYIRF